jgi:hypothetical protein
VVLSEAFVAAVIIDLLNADTFGNTSESRLEYGRLIVFGDLESIL